MSDPDRIDYGVTFSVRIDGDPGRADICLDVRQAFLQEQRPAPQYVNAHDGSLVMGWSFSTPEPAQALHDRLLSFGQPGVTLDLHVERHWEDD